MNLSNVLAERNEADLVKLGASPRTPAVVLSALAADSPVTVRAAVAMNPATPDHAHATLTADNDDRVRMLLARKLAALAPTLGSAEQDRLENHAVQLLRVLVEDEAERVRAAIADVVKDMANVPRDLILRLASDAAISVSGPVIQLSPMLSQEDLLALLAAPPTPTTIAVIARRPHLTEPVSDAIAATADSAAIQALLSNRSAAIREATLDSLIAQAVRHVEWHEPLVQRPVLAAPAARALSDIVSTHLLEALASRGDLDPALTADLRNRLNARLANGDVETKPVELTNDQAMEQARVHATEGRLNETMLLAAARRGDARETAALLATAAGVPLAVVERATLLRSAKGLISLCWKAGFSMRLAGPLQSLLARIPPGGILQPGPGGNFPLAIEEMRWQLEFLGRASK